MKLCEEEEWPEDVCQAILKYSEEIREGYREEIEESLNGCTYVAIKDCIRVNQSLNDQTQAIDITEVCGETVETMYTTPWPCVRNDIMYYGKQWMSYSTKLPSYTDEYQD